MNLIPRIPLDNAVHENVPFKWLLYIYLLSNCEANDGLLKVVVDYDEIYDLFKIHGEDKIESAFQELNEDGIIDFLGNVVLVGTIAHKNSFDLYKSEDELQDFKVWTDKVLNVADTYIESLSSTKRVATANYCKKQLEKIISNDVWNASTVGTLFVYLHEAVQQVVYRDLLTREYGQLKNTLLKLYHARTVAKMVIQYLCNSHKYSKMTPSVSALLICKDAVAADINKQNKVSNKAKTTSDF